jgi:hypothetical protein
MGSGEEMPATGSGAALRDRAISMVMAFPIFS